MSFSIQGNNGVQVNAGSAGLEVALPEDKDLAGNVVVVMEDDDGSVTGTVRRTALTSGLNSRLSVGIDTPLFSEQFPGTALNSAVWNNANTTMTTTVTNTYCQLNAANNTTTSTMSGLYTRRFFPMYGVYGTKLTMILALTQLPQTNNTCEWGFGLAPAQATPLDGAFFRLNVLGEFRCVLNLNTTEVQSATLNFATLVGTSTSNEFSIIVTKDLVEYSINGVVVAILNRQTNTGAPTMSGELPAYVRIYNTGVPALAQQIRVGFVGCSVLDAHAAKPWAHTMAGMGNVGAQGQTGATMGSTANYANSANPSPAVPTNTTAALGTGLGGQFWETNSLALNTDGIICSYLVPAGVAALPGKMLYITGVWISSYVQTVLVGGGFNETWVLNFGHTSLTLATAEGANSKAPRRIPLGSRTVAAAATALTQLADIKVSFATPIPVYSGEYVALSVKKVGTVGTSGTIAHVIGFDSYWE